jgi:hypothetical protein
MSNSLRAGVALTLVALGAAGCRAAGNDLPKGVRAVLDNADRFEVLSLDPTRQKEKPKDDFHGWKVLGRTEVKDAETRKKVVAALYKGIADSDGKVAGCFNPRHGIRATHDGQTVELVICYECLSMQAYLGTERSSALTTPSPEKTFDQVLRDAKVPLAPKAK